MFKMRVRHGQKLIRKESAQDRDTSMHRLIWSAVRNWVPVPESAFAPSERARGALVKATLSPKTFIRTREVLPAATFPPIAVAVLHGRTKAHADLDKLQQRAAKFTSDHAESFLLRDPDQVLDKGQAGTTLH